MAISPEVVVGTLLDWPLAARVAKLLALPPESLHLACYQVVGQHGAAVSKAVFRTPEVVTPVVAAHQDAILGILELCTKTPGAASKFGFHGSMTVPALREELSEQFTVHAPSEALAARRAKPAASRKAIETALKSASIGSRKALYAFVDGGPFKESLTRLDGHDLSYGCLTGVDVHNEVEARLAFAWCHCASRDTMPPHAEKPGTRVRPIRTHARRSHPDRHARGCSARSPACTQGAVFAVVAVDWRVRELGSSCAISAECKPEGTGMLTCGDWKAEPYSPSENRCQVVRTGGKVVDTCVSHDDVYVIYTCDSPELWCDEHDTMTCQARAQPGPGFGSRPRGRSCPPSGDSDRGRARATTP